MSSVFQLFVIILLSLLTGFAYQRGSLCAVQAVRDLVQQGRWQLLLSFAQCAGWSWFLLWGLATIGAGSAVSHVGMTAERTLFWPALGGVLFGIGAWLNRGCSFGTLMRLGSGNLNFLLTPFAAALGMLLVQWHWQEGLPANALAVVPLMLGAHSVGWLIMQALLLLLFVSSLLQLLDYRIWRLRWWFKPAWPPTLAVAVIALASLGLLASSRAWPGVGEPLMTWRSSHVLAAGLLLALILLGAAIGAKSAGRFEWVAPTLRSLPRAGTGGLLMGIGAAWVPGGNSRMLTLGIPLLETASLVGYLAMLASLFLLTLLATHSKPARHVV